MTIPGFTAERSLLPARGHYRSGQAIAALAAVVVPAIPRCENCLGILRRCNLTGGKPRATCEACAKGYCDSTEEPGPNCRYDPIRDRFVCDL
jgi:hypothetical protein